jgi:hypothetical protein
MEANNKVDFNWEELLWQIKRKDVIPVIGHGLYRVEIKSEETSECLLYDFLAKRLADACGQEVHTDSSRKFSKVAFDFLRKNNNDYKKLSHFLEETLQGVRLIPANPLWKLARIKAFNIFITTAHDNFLIDTINTVRTVPTEVRCYGVRDKGFALLDHQLLHSLMKSERTLVYHILGHLKINMLPAYTEKDILETIIEFQKDMVSTRSDNQLFGKLENSSLLFLGCGYNDWLFRFFIRTLANEPFDCSRSPGGCKFVEDDFGNIEKYPHQELAIFLKNYETEVFYSCDDIDFVDLLFEKIANDSRFEIIQPEDFPVTVFLSYAWDDKPAADRLATSLRKDGISVWMDERNLEPGDEVDESIIKAIDKCPAFIPLLSVNSQRGQGENGKLRYHRREWERAYTNIKSGDKAKEVTVIPVKIDNSDWIYEDFKKFNVISIPGGSRTGDYEKLKDKLINVQQHIRGRE